MFIQFLGTGAGVPAKARNVSSLALKLLDELNEVWLFDCGEATQHQILQTTLRPRKISKIFITHLHGDHIFGLPGFLSSRSFQGGSEALTIYGPQGIKEFVLTSLKLSRSRLTYPLKFVELSPQGGQIKLANDWIVDYLPLDHGILSFGFRVTQPDLAGQLLMDRLEPYQIPNGPLLGKLKRGETIELEDGRILNGRDFISPNQPGKVVTILGDTRLTDNGITLAKEADLLVHEATFEESEAALAKRYFHSTNTQAAYVASQARAKKLLLNHISARYLGHQAKYLENQACHVFSATQVVVDLAEYPI
ncbi:ribonuclease Z [Vaginisenegalia massiliensis]|uniref:ribonuclease Z n=1 Tax=Vaginisenegalia massiliensis TaxID=2058294 RepID=UPI000F53D273|nr:ribonuclease Z [Vaginisenegalia massiliensis]